MINLGGIYEQALAFPPHDVSPDTKKSKEYTLQFCRAFYSAWLRNETLWGYSDIVKFDGLRKIAVGKQPDDMYYQMCYGKTLSGEIIRKGYMNVNWEILKIAVKYRNAFVGMFTDIDYEIQASSVNPYATRKKQEKKWKAWVDTKIMPQLKIDPAQMGVESPIDAMEMSKPQMEPEDLTELEVMDNLGMFRLEEELAFEQFIKVTFDVIAEFPEKIKDKILEDLWDIGKAVIKDFVDPVTQKVSVRYTDAANCVLRRRTDGSLLDGGEFMLLSIADLRAESDFTEEELLRVAGNFTGRFGNMTRDVFERNKGRLDTSKQIFSTYFYNDIKVMVLDCEYATVNQKYTTEVKTDKGTKYFPEEYGRKRNSAKRKTHVTKQSTYYRGKWIVGTELCYDYGMQYDIPRPDKTRANCSFHYVELTTPSPVEVASPLFHQSQLMWLKFQNAWAKAKPDGYAYDEAQLISSTLGGKLKPDELIKMSEQSGRLFYKTTNVRGQAAMAPNAGPPVMPMPGGIGQALNEFAGTWNIMVDMLQELTGLSRQATASAMPAKTGKGVSEIALGATNNVMKPMINCYRNIKQMAAKNVLLRGQIVFRHNQEIAKDYYDILGEATVEMIKQASKDASQIGIKLIPRINDEMRAKIEQAALEAMAVDRNGGSGITAKDFVMIQSLLDQGANPKLIQGALAMYEQRRSKMKEESALAATREQSNGLVQLEAAKGEQNARMEILKAYLDIQKIAAKAEIEANKNMAENVVNNIVNQGLSIAMGEQGMPQQGGGMPEMGGMPMPPQPNMDAMPMEEAPMM
jgi:hypothetical protein